MPRGGRFAGRLLGWWPWLAKVERFVARKRRMIARLRISHGGGVAASAFILLAAVGYGLVAGGHIDPLMDAGKDMRDAIGRAFGFRIATIGFSGTKNITHEEILAGAGVTATSSLLFFDVTAARARLMSDPRISDATLLKLYPDRLQISIVERRPYALWQINRKVSLVANDGTVLTPYVSKEYISLPMFVGRGAEKRGKDLMALIDRFPEIRDNLRASILVAERRWNLRLKNGLDIKLPETDVVGALSLLSSLEREKRIFSRDIVSIDLREPDRVTVQLSEAAAAARDAAVKAKPKKGGSA